MINKTDAELLDEALIEVTEKELLDSEAEFKAWVKERLDDALFFLNKARQELEKEHSCMTSAWGYSENVGEIIEEVTDRFNEEM